MRAFPIAAILVALALPLQSAEPPAPAAKPRAELRETLITLPEAKASLKIPEKWLNFQKHFRLDPDRIAALAKPATGEWDSAYGPVTDAVLPLADCLLHIGNDGWDKDAVSFHDVQMRAYLSDAKPDAIKDLLQTKGIPAATAARGTALKTDIKTEAPWTINHIQFNLWYGDYGATAHVYFYSRPAGGVGNKTLTLVFMMIDRDTDIADRNAILKSVAME